MKGCTHHVDCPKCAKTRERLLEIKISVDIYESMLRNGNLVGETAEKYVKDVRFLLEQL